MNEQSESLGDKLLRKKQVAEMLAHSVRSVDRLVQKKILTPVRILGGVRFRLSEVQALINGGVCD